MPTKTNKKPATKRVASSSKNKRSKKQSGVQRLLSRLGGKGSPLVALLVVAAVVAVGYFGYVYSSASSNKTSADAQRVRVACREKHPNNQEALQRCIKNSEPVAATNNQLQPADKKVECSKQLRYQKTPTECGTCLGGAIEKGGNCVKGQPTDGAVKCTDGFVDSKGECRKGNSNDPAQVQQRCKNENRDYLPNRNNCGPCKEKYFQSGTACAKVNTTPVATVKADCAAKFRVYDPAGNVCGGDCKTGYYQNANNSACVQLSAAVKRKAQAECTKLFRNYNAQTNSCGSCAGSRVAVDKVCKLITKKDLELAQKACADQKLAFRANTATCAKTCIEGFAKNAADKCVTLTNLSDKEAAKLCANSGLQFVYHSKVCSTDCNAGRLKDAEGNCRQPAAIKADCNAQKQRFDPVTNTCTDACMTDFIKTNGTCQELQSTMNQRLCRALGRSWAPVVFDDNPTQKVYACTSFCLDPLATYTVKDSNITSYCNPPASAKRALSLTMTAEQCAKQGRLYLNELKACSGLCANGYAMDGKVCKPIKAEEVEQPENSVCEGDVVRRVCTTDPDEPAANENADGQLESNVEANRTEESCLLLGRMWVKDRKVDGKKVEGGCSTQKCRIDDLNVKKSGTSYYCPRNIDRISQEQCKSLHRLWMPSVEGCAARTHENAKKQVKRDAPQCVGKFSVYVYDATKVQRGDECVTPKAFDRIKSVADIAGKPVSFVTGVGAKVVCERQKKMEWHDRQCRKVVVRAKSQNNGGRQNNNSSNNNNSPGSTSTNNDPSNPSNPGTSDIKQEGCQEGGCGPVNTTPPPVTPPSNCSVRNGEVHCHGGSKPGNPQCTVPSSTGYPINC